MATIHDLPDAILSLILASISDTRSRNAASLVSHKFLAYERSTRTSLTLRGNVRDLFQVPTSFTSVTHLDISLLSPWGHPILDSDDQDSGILLAHCLSFAFPRITSLTVYARAPSTLQILLRWGHQLSHVKLIRWHQRSSSPHLGADIAPLFNYCQYALKSVDLSDFYYWTEDIPAVLQAYPEVSASLTSLNLLSRPLIDGFRSQEIRDITAACPNLTSFLVLCAFDPSYNGFVGDEALLAIAANCARLKVLHLVAPSSLVASRGDLDDQEGFTDEDAKISRVALMDFFAGLPLLEELVLDVCKNVRDTSLALETMHSKCPRLKVLKLGLFHGICLAIESQLDGVALCSGLQSLSIKKSADLTDMGLIEIGRGCCRLTKFEVHGCNKITVNGMRTMVCLLRRTLIDVSISGCKNLDATASLQALESIQDRIERLHIDCVWNGLEEDGSQEGSYSDELEYGSDELEYGSQRKKCKYSDSSSENANRLRRKSWDRLRYLSLWISVGELLTSLQVAGLARCPVLEEIRIKVEGDCRGRQKPTEKAFGLNCLIKYGGLMKLQLDCSETVGFALTAPSGQMDLSLWERFFLHGIGELSLYELDYWPPQDKDVNDRSLSLPAAGLLGECSTLRKLFIHGTAHEHFMRFLLGIPNLRDVQLREDYYPAPENDMSTEMRVASCSRFEDALNSRPIVD